MSFLGLAQSGSRDPASVAGGTSLLALDTCLREAPHMARHQRRPLYVLEDTESPGLGYVAPVGNYALRDRVVANVSREGQVTKQVNAIRPAPPTVVDYRDEPELARQVRPVIVPREEPTRRVGLAPEMMNLELQALTSLLAELRQTAVSLVDQAPPGYDVESLVEAIGAAEDTCGEIQMLAED